MRRIHTIAVFIFLFLLLAGCFYWFQWRPVSIRKNCYKESYAKYEEWRNLNKSNDKNEWKQGKEWINNPENNNNSDWGWWYPTGGSFADDLVYADCLLKHGLKAELPILNELINLKK